MHRRRLKRAGLLMLSVWLAVVAFGWFTSWRRLPYYEVTIADPLPAEIMSGDQYESVINTHPRPYVVLAEGAGGSVLIYGAEHTKDPADPQILDIRERWAAFRPTVALCESRLGILFPQLMDPVREFGEPGFVHGLAREAGIPTYTWEPTPAAYVASLLRTPFAPEQIALRLKLGPYFSNLRFGKPSNPEAFVLDTLTDDSRWPGLEDQLKTIDQVDEAWRSYFPEGPDWRDVSDEFDLPGFLSGIDTNSARDEHFMRVVRELVARGERVFAVAGLSHAVRVEATTRALIGR